jgi:hypothetical protein
MTFSWDEAFHQLWALATRHRGLSAPHEPLADNLAQVWPRTRGSDVLAIAAVVDPLVRALPAETGNLGISRRWRYCASDLVEFALDQPEREYVHNRAFWPTVAATMAYLASIHAPVPIPLWGALLAELANPAGSRELVRDDYLYLAADSYQQLWQVQRLALSELRGVDRPEPAPETGARASVPRTTNGDIFQLATFWTLALIKAEPHGRDLAPDVLETLGLDGVKRRWQAVQADVDGYAKAGDPRDVYPKNHEFWRATASIAVAISALDDLPLSLDLAVGGHPVRRNARTQEIHEGTFDGVWTAQRDAMTKLRGDDAHPPIASEVGGPWRVARTTNADIIQLAAYWDTAWTQRESAAKPGALPAPLDSVRDTAGERTRWRETMADVDRLAKTGRPGDLYPRNFEFWRAARSLAAALDRSGAPPVPSRLVLDSPEASSRSLGERLLEAAKALPGQIADAAGSVAHAVGNFAHDAGAGAFSGLGKPLLVGGGVLLGLYLLLRNCDHREAR